MARGADEPGAQVTIGLVGGGNGGAALLDLLLDWPAVKIAVVVDPRPDAPALVRARALGIPTGATHLEVFAYPVDLVFEVTGQPGVLDDLLNCRLPGVEVMGAASLRFFWDLIQERAKAARQVHAQLDMAVALGSTLDFHEQVVILTRKLAEACGVDRCTLYLWEEETERLIPVMSQFVTGEANGQMWETFKALRRRPLTEVPFLAAVAERRSPIEIEDPARDPRIPRGWADRFEIKSLLVVPIFRKERVVGACVLDYCREARRFTPEQTGLATALAEQVALALENARLYQEVADKATRLALLLESTKRTAAIHDSRELLSWIVEEAARFLEGHGAGIRILEGEALRLAAHYGYGRDGLQDRVALGESGTGWAVRTNRAVAIADLERDARVLPQHRAALCQKGFRSMLAVPMRICERAIGALYVLTTHPHQFSAAEIEALSGFADQAALAVENLRLYEAAQERARALEALYRDLRQVQEQLVQAERLKAFGQLAAGVAHDFNNLLTAILGRAQLLLRQERLAPDLARELRVIEQAALDGRRIVELIQGFSRTRPPRPHGRVDLAQILREVMELTRPRWKDDAEAAGIAYEVRIEAEPRLAVAGDPVELRQAGMNLLLNALEAMPRGGQVSLKAGRAGDRVTVTVADTGCGMPAEVRRAAFEPFFTTKSPKGTGLGLSVVWGIVQRHGGEITLESAEGRGTTFTLAFPVEPQTVEPEASPPGPWPARRARILIIDDEPEVRAILGQFLRAQGHTVVEAADGTAGLARADAEAFDLALVDLIMPGLSGWAVAAILNSRDLAVGVITGWPGEADPDQAAALGVEFVLTKPFELDEVLRCVAGVLGSGGAPPAPPRGAERRPPMP